LYPKKGNKLSHKVVGTLKGSGWSGILIHWAIIIIKNQIANTASVNNNHSSTMVTFTLTPTNAKSIPRNVVHLIVAEGVIEVPDSLCYELTGIKSLETVVFSKSVTVIGCAAFIFCHNLRSVIFPNDSQLRVIGHRAFLACESLRSIDIPDSVTIIGVYAFCVCSNLESIIIPNSVTTIGYGAFCKCSKLKSVIFAEHSSIQTIESLTFYKCTLLQSINIPTTVTTIHEYAFERCPVLQVIDIPRQAIVNPTAFKNCHLLSTTLEEHGTDCLKGRFDALPIHQPCYKLNNTTSSVDIINYFCSLQDNDQALLQVDSMGMTPLHILCANPSVTKDMIKQLYTKNTEAGGVLNVNDMLPWHIYVVNKDKQFGMFIEDEDEDEDGDTIISTTMTDTARMILSNEFNVDALVDTNLDIDTKEMYLTLTGSSLVEWLETTNGVTGLYPFMSMATESNDYNLEKVYEFAMMNLNSILQRELPARNSKHSGSKLTTDRRNTKRMKFV
jgi:hypothetical protein